MSKKDKELTKKEMEETVGGLKTRRTTEEPTSGGTIPVGPDAPTEPLNDPPHGGLTPGGKSTG